MMFYVKPGIRFAPSGLLSARSPEGAKRIPEITTRSRRNKPACHIQTRSCYSPRIN